ncbi:hypothetical protein FOMA001_g2167 [Fusarium oxysporum f. sp. matthiolae]|nr:hypothetical protein FOMA001_g2167 [Fusarium oxysporum f. sp. matthiolae]
MSEEYINGDNGEALAKANNDDDKFFVNNNGGNCGSSKVDDDGDEDDEDWVSWTKAGNTNTPKVELYSKLGSVIDPSDMVNCETVLNGYKALVIGVWQYLNNDKVLEKLANVHIAVADFLDEFEKLYRIQYPKTGPMGLFDIHWRSFISGHFNNMVAFTQEWTKLRLQELQKYWNKHLNDLSQELQKTKSGTARAAQLTSDITTARDILKDVRSNWDTLRTDVEFDMDIFKLN